MIELLLENAEFAARKPDLASNFKSKLVSRTDLGIEEKVVDIQYMREGRTNRPGPHTKTYQVKITKGHVLPLVNFMQCLSAPCANNAFPQKEEMLTALNILLGHNRESIDTITTIEQKGFSIVRPSTGNELSEGEGRLSSMASIRSI